MNVRTPVVNTRHHRLYQLITVLLAFTFTAVVGRSQSGYHFQAEQTVNPANYISKMSLGDKALMGGLKQYWLSYNVLWNGDSYKLKGQALLNGLSANLDLGIGEMERTLKYSLALEKRAEGGVHVLLNWEFIAKNGQPGAGTEILGYLEKNSPNTLKPMASSFTNNTQNIKMSTKSNFVGTGLGHYETISYWSQTSYPHPQNPYGMLVIATEHIITYWVQDPSVMDDCLHEYTFE